MADRLVRLAKLTYVPSVQEVIASPARCWTLRESEPTYWTDPRTGKWRVSGYVNRWVTYCVPAVEGVAGREAQLKQTDTPGWTAGAKSASAVAGDVVGAFSFSPMLAGAVCGIAGSGAPVGSFAAIEHGFYCIGDGYIQVVERGVAIAASPYRIIDYPRMTVTRAGGYVTYAVDDWQLVRPALFVGVASLFAVLYAASDYIDSPSFGALVTVPVQASWDWDVRLDDRALSLHIPWGWRTARSIPVPWDWAVEASTELLNSVSASVPWDVNVYVGVNNGYATLPIDMAMRAGDVPRVWGGGEVADLVLTARAGFTDVEVVGASIVLPFELRGSATKAGGCVGTLVVDMDMVGAGPEGYSRAVLDIDMDGFGISMFEPEGTGMAFTSLQVGDSWILDPVIYGAFSEVLNIGTSVDFLVVIDGALAEVLALQDGMSASAIILAMIQSGMCFSDNASHVISEVAQFATNVTSGAVSFYTGFDFIQFARVGQKTYGLRPDGLYEIGQSDQLLDACVEFAADPAGTMAKKRVAAVMVGADTDGQVYVRTENDEGQFVTYATINRGEVYRADIGRGYAARYWKFRLELVEASHAVLDDIEWVSGGMARRTQGKRR